MHKTILLIKLGSLGDVLRTTCLLTGLKRKYPQGRIAWIVENEGAYTLLKNNPLIDDLYSARRVTPEAFKSRTIDLLINLDEDPAALTLASSVPASEKLGYGYNDKREMIPFNKESEYAFRLHTDDELKFRKNTQTYQQIIYGMSKLEYQNDEYPLSIPRDQDDVAGALLKNFGISRNDFVLGLVTGAGPRFANKSWTVQGFVELIKQLHQKTTIKMLLLGGPDEVKKYETIEKQTRDFVLPAGCHTSIWQFAALINKCHCLVSGDTAAMHMAIALKKAVVAIFGPTCPQEIDLYGRGIKIVSTIECAPCYLNVCPKTFTCMDKIKVEEIFQAILRFVPPERIIKR